MLLSCAWRRAGVAAPGPQFLRNATYKIGCAKRLNCRSTGNATFAAEFPHRPQNFLGSGRIVAVVELIGPCGAFGPAIIECGKPNCRTVFRYHGGRSSGPRLRSCRTKRSLRIPGADARRWRQLQSSAAGRAGRAVRRGGVGYAALRSPFSPATAHRAAVACRCAARSGWTLPRGQLNERKIRGPCVPRRHLLWRPAGQHAGGR